MRFHHGGSIAESVGRYGQHFRSKVGDASHFSDNVLNDFIAVGDMLGNMILRSLVFSSAENDFCSLQYKPEAVTEFKRDFKTSALSALPLSLVSRYRFRYSGIENRSEWRHLASVKIVPKDHLLLAVHVT